MHLEINWWHGYGNSPEFVLHATPPKHEDFEYMIRNGDDKYIWLISTNQSPWVKYVAISDPDGQPNLHGALGGEYKLVSGGTFKTRTGWSSRASVVNRDFPEMLPCGHITEVVVVTPTGSRWAGFNLPVSTMQALLHPSLHIVKQIHRDGEIAYYPSTQPDKVVKPHVPTPHRAAGNV